MTRPVLEPDVETAMTSTWTPTEEEFTALFLAIADRLGWPADLRYHTHDSRRSRGGYPDWHLVSLTQRRSVFVELKGFGGKPTDAQRLWITALNAAGGEAYLVTTTGDAVRDSAAIWALLSPRTDR